MEDDAEKYFEKVRTKLNKFVGKDEIGDEMQQKIILAKTDRGARTNGRIDAIQKGKSFDESETPRVELDEANNDIVNEYINRAIKDLFGE